MVGTAIGMMGGISSVVGVYKKHGLFEQWSVSYVASHVDGSSSQKLRILIVGWFKFLALLIMKTPDIVHIQSSSSVSFLRKMAFFIPAKLARRPIIIHVHTGNIDGLYYNLSPIRRRLVVKALESCALVIALSPEWLAKFKEIAPRANVTSLANPVELPDLDRQLQPPLSLDVARILFLGRLGPQKGTYDLLNAFKLIADKYPKAVLQLGGDGELEKINQLARELHLSDRVHTLGWVRGQSKDQLLREATVFVLPSYSEGLPMGVLEAMAYRLPVIATPVGGVPGAVRDGQEGLLVAAGDVAQLAEALDRVLADPNFASRLGSAGRLRAEQFYGADVVIKRLGEIYASLCEPAQPVRTAS